jgi:hypothetical protein
MKVIIEVNDREEAEAIEAGLKDPAMRAFILVMGTHERARKRGMQFIADYFDRRNKRHNALKSKL